MKLNIQNISQEILDELEMYQLSGIVIKRANLEDVDIFVKLYNRAFMRGQDPWSPATEKQFENILNQLSLYMSCVASQSN